MKKSFLVKDGIVISIYTDGINGFVETALPCGQFGYIRTTAKVTDIEIQTMIVELKKQGYQYND